MDIGSIFLVLALAAVVGLFIARPFLEGDSQKSAQSTSSLLVNAEEQEQSSLLAERDRLLTALSELDFDHLVGKIPEEDYPAQRSMLLHQGADVLRKLDDLQAANGQTAASQTAEARLEAAIAARRAALAGAKVGSNGNGFRTEDDDLEVLIASRRRARQEKSGGFCPQCGLPVQISDRFCPKCGTVLKR